MRWLTWNGRFSVIFVVVSYGLAYEKYAPAPFQWLNSINKRYGWLGYTIVTNDVW